MSTTTKTPEEIEAMRAEIAEFDRQAALAKAAEEAEHLRPLREFTTSTAYQTVLTGFAAIAQVYRDDTRFSAFLDCLKVGLPELAKAAGPLPVPPVYPEA